MRRAKAFASDLIGPLGPKALDKAIRNHLDLFSDLRSSGASWAQIAELMNRHGIRKKDGTVMSPVQWMAVFSRAKKMEASCMPLVNTDEFSLKQNQPTFSSNNKKSTMTKKETPYLASTGKTRDRTSIRATMKKALLVRSE